MRSNLTRSIFCLAVWYLAACGGAAERVTPESQDGTSTLASGRQLTDAFFSGDLDRLWNRMTLEMRDAAGGSVEELRSFRQKVAELAGEEREVLNDPG